MRSLYLFGSLLLLLIFCAHTRMAQNATTMLLGEHPREDLQKAPFSAWFNKNYAAFTIHKDSIRILSPLLSGLSFEIFMGTWCPDSRREVPRMLKILDACHVPAGSIRIIMVDYREGAYKQSPGHEEKGKDIRHVPDLLVLDHGREKGRIVESPVVSLENDLLAIAADSAYKPHYSDSH